MQGILRFDLQIVFLDIGHSVFWRAKLFFQISLELSWMVGRALDWMCNPYKCKAQIVFTKESTLHFSENNVYFWISGLTMWHKSVIITGILEHERATFYNSRFSLIRWKFHGLGCSCTFSKIISIVIGRNLNSKKRTGQFINSLLNIAIACFIRPLPLVEIFQYSLSNLFSLFAFLIDLPTMKTCMSIPINLWMQRIICQ